MDLESGAMAALVLGFVLGLKHATDADHVVAVSTIVSEQRNAWQGIWVGGSWGLGHTTPLLLLGIVILLFKDAVLDSYERVAPVFEFGVGVMLVALGAQVFWNLRRGRLHLHQHVQDSGPHVHIHATHSPEAVPEVERLHGFFRPGKPFFRMKSFVIGIVHGLAGQRRRHAGAAADHILFRRGGRLSGPVRRWHYALYGGHYPPPGGTFRRRL